MRLPVHQFLNYVWTWCIERVPHDKLEEWVRQINAPLPGMEAKPTDSELEADASAFMAAMAQHGGGR